MMIKINCDTQIGKKKKQTNKQNNYEERKRCGN